MAPDEFPQNTPRAVFFSPQAIFPLELLSEGHRKGVFNRDTRPRVLAFSLFIFFFQTHGLHFSFQTPWAHETFQTFLRALESSRQELKSGFRARRLGSNRSPCFLFVFRAEISGRSPSSPPPPFCLVSTPLAFCFRNLPTFRPPAAIFALLPRPARPGTCRGRAIKGEEL